MPVPQALVRPKPAVAYQIRMGDKKGTNGAPRALDHFVIKAMSGLQETGAVYLKNKDGGDIKEPKEVDIILARDVPEQNYKDGIAFWDGARPGCTNWDGDDKAQRRMPNGSYQECRCDITRCPMWLNHHSDDPRVPQYLSDPASELRQKWPALKLDSKSKCTVQFFLWCQLPGLTAAGEWAQFYSQSLNTYNQIRTALETIALQTGGALAHIPLKLKIVMIRDPYGKYKPTATVIAGERDLQVFNQRVLESRSIRQLQGMDWQTMDKFSTVKALAEATGQDNEFILEHFVETRGTEEGYSPNVRALAAAGSTFVEDEGEGEELPVLADEECRRLQEAAGVPEHELRMLALDFGDNVAGARSHLTALATQQKDAEKGLEGEGLPESGGADQPDVDLPAEEQVETEDLTAQASEPEQEEEEELDPNEVPPPQYDAPEEAPPAAGSSGSIFGAI